jgi:hypothetical protein
MKQTVIRYGLFAAVFIIALFCIQMFWLADLVKLDVMEVAGYLTMLLSMIFVFFGMRYYRNEKNNGQLSFGKGLKVGILIVLFPAIFFGLFDVLYTEVINPQWEANYQAHYLSEMKASMTPAKFEIEKKSFDSQMEFFKNPFFHFLVMFATVLVIGFIVTIISSLALRRKPAMAKTTN